MIKAMTRISGAVGRKQLFILLSALLAGNLWGVESYRIDTLSIEQALVLAENHHPELAEARALAEAAAGRTQQAGLLPNPELIGRIEALPLERNSGQEADYLVGLSQALPLGSRLDRARNAERWDQLRFSREIELKRLEVRKAVHGAFATALYQERAGILQSGITADLEAAAGIARARVEHGDAAPDELARAELELARGRVERQRSEALRHQAAAALANVVGVPNLVVGSLSGRLEDVLELATLESVAGDLERSPTLGVAQATVEEKRARIDLARAERIPDIKVEVLYRRQDSSNAIDLGMAIPLPIFDGSQGRLRAARAELAAAEARARATMGRTERLLRDTQAQLAAALDQVQALRTEILPRAEAIRISMEKRYRAGDVSLGELIPINRDWAAVELTYLEALREVMAAWTELRALAGDI